MLGILSDPILVRALAIKHGLEPDAADRLEEIARKIAEGRAVKGGDRMTKTKAKELVARFEQEADESPNDTVTSWARSTVSLLCGCPARPSSAPLTAT